MKQNAAPRSMSIKIVTGFVMILLVLFIAISMREPGMLPAAIILAVISLFCYLYSPASFEITDGRLIVNYNLGKKEFGRVMACSTLDKPLSMGIRTWGNGGLFAGTGRFWNKQFGHFRAYVTSARYEDYVLVETQTKKIIISPAEPQVFVGNWSDMSRTAQEGDG